MADNRNIVQRALDKLQADKLAQQEAAMAQQAPASIAAPVPAVLAAPVPTAPANIGQQLTPDIMSMQAVVPPQATQEEQIKRQLEERAQQAKDVLEVLRGRPFETPLQKQMKLEREAAEAAKLKAEADAKLAEEQASTAAAQQQIEAGMREPSSAAGEAVRVAQTPDPEEVSKKVDAIMEPEREQAATDVAATAAASEREQLQQQALERIKQEVELEDEARAAVEKTDQEVRVKSLPQIFAEGTFGQKLGTAIAVVLGGIGQGLTGARTNPVTDMIDRLVQQQADRDKLKIEQRESLRRMVYDAAEQQIRRMQAQTNDQYRKDQMEIARAGLRQKASEIGQEQQAAARQVAKGARLNFGKRLSVDDIATLSEEQQNRKVQLERVDPATGQPMQVLASNRPAAENFRQYNADVATAATAIDELMKLADDPTAYLDFVKRGKGKMLQEALVGALRLPFKGPGSLQLQEQKDLREIAENPATLFTVRSWSKERLGALKNHLYTRLQATAKTSGINEPVTPQVLRVSGKRVVPEESLMAALRKKNPTASQEALAKAINEAYPIFEGF